MENKKRICKNRKNHKDLPIILGEIKSIEERIGNRPWTWTLYLVTPLSGYISLCGICTQRD